MYACMCAANPAGNTPREMARLKVVCSGWNRMKEIPSEALQDTRANYSKDGWQIPEASLSVMS